MQTHTHTHMHMHTHGTHTRMCRLLPDQKVVQPSNFLLELESTSVSIENYSNADTAGGQGLLVSWDMQVNLNISIWQSNPVTYVP